MVGILIVKVQSLSFLFFMHMQKATDNHIDVRSKPVNVDKRGLGKGEMAVQISKMHMQAIMLSTRLGDTN